MLTNKIEKEEERSGKGRKKGEVRSTTWKKSFMEIKKGGYFILSKYELDL